MSRNHPIRLAGGLTPDILASRHPLWAADVRTLGPWEREGKGYVARIGGSAPVTVLDECASALDAAWERQSELPEWGAVIAVRQSSGRGQLRRAWASEPGNLHVAARLPLEPPGSRWIPLTPLLVGWLLAEGLAGQGVHVDLKWPNDLLQSGRKVGGVLLEDRGGTALMGAGLNLAAAPGTGLLRAGNAQPAGVLDFTGEAPGPLGLWRALVKALKTGYKRCASEGDPETFVKTVEDRLAHVGSAVIVSERSGDSYQAVVLGLSPEGGLRLLVDGVETILFSGSIRQR